MSKTSVILLVEDNEKILSANRWILEERGYRILTAASLAEARAVLAKETPDLAVLDIMLPDGDGLEFLPELRSICKIPVLFLTGKIEQEEIIEGLRAGSNDYITKPYKIDEFCARVEAALAWEMSHREDIKITKGSLTLDISSNQAYISGEILDLSKTEIKLLALFMKNEGETITFETIYQNIWNRPMGDDKNAIQAAVKRLRHKIEPAGYDIYAVRGKGYVFEIG
jgi:DNA-binding response OmpR family regulator